MQSQMSFYCRIQTNNFKVKYDSLAVYISDFTTFFNPYFAEAYFYQYSFWKKWNRRINQEVLNAVLNMLCFLLAWNYFSQANKLPSLLYQGRSADSKIDSKFSRSSHRRCSVKKGVLKISQISQENTCVRVSF